MSSHREAPAISKDPVADSSDLYAFVSPDSPGTVTIIANYVPLQDPSGGPNFFEFGDDVQYDINIVNDTSGVPAITYHFNFTTTVEDQNTAKPGSVAPGAATFLYATGKITSLTDANFNRRQTYTLQKILRGGAKTTLSPVGGGTLRCPPCNIGPRSTPNYSTLAGDAIYRLTSGENVFAGQRAEGFFVDLGSIFDLGDLRPLSPDQVYPGTAIDRHQLARRQERAQHRPANTDQLTDLERRHAGRSRRSPCGNRGVHHRQPPGHAQLTTPPTR